MALNFVAILNELNITTGSAFDVWGALTYWHDDRDCSELDQTYSAIRSLKLSGEAIDESKKQYLDILKSLAKFGRVISSSTHSWRDLESEARPTGEITSESSN